jgi:type I restriction-modification system DNA methylase subunit
LYNNRSLFSDYYLRELVRDDPHWRDVLAGVPALRQKIADIYKRGMPGIEQVAEAEVERRLIRPVLNALGHVYEVQPDVRSSEGTKTPDYGFFATVDDRNRASAAGIDEYWKHALAVGDAKAWDRSLDRRLKGPGDPFTNHNPSYQIDFYLRAADLKWGILTNGRLWRLYYRDLSYRLDVHYEVNLSELLERTDEEFNYFAAFFSQRAFIPDEQGVRFLDRAYKGSLDYATGLSKELKDNVYETLRLLTEGFLRFPGNGLALEQLDRIRENAFVVIYRLLFILYAEDRGFLPLENRDYGDTYSLRALARDIAQKLDGRVGLSSAASGYWSRLQDIFRMIDAGDAALGIPPYNGGLFDESRHRELGQWRVGDSHLAQAIDMLTRATAAERTGRGFVSYRELSIRELGSIYEGLLEHRPRVAETEASVVRDGKAEKIVPPDQVGKRRVIGSYPAGSVYLETDRGERKATGSYYTPDYVVNYIVANTLGPLIEERKERSADLVEALLSLKVLDPAMGSGHFLVEATDFLARALVEALGGAPTELEQDDIRWARREVVERCIYGVDVNPLAVELAKLSLWLHTVSRDRPLNFLDHHLRCGNTLIGTWLKELGQLPGPPAKRAAKKARPPTAIMTLEEHGLREAIAAAVRTFHKIAKEPTHTVEDVHRKENAHQTARHALAHIVDIGDAWMSAYFGLGVERDPYASLLLAAYSREGEWPKPGEMPWLDKARDLAKEKEFFHWELEFPEVFFDGTGHRLEDPGFSAVIANPPYLSVINIPKPERDFFLGRFATATGRFDLYVLFLEQALRLISSDGRVGLINPIKFAIYANGRILRRLILDRFHLERFVDISQCQVFEDPTTYPCIVVLRRRPAELGSPIVHVAQIEQSQLPSWFDQAVRGEKGVYVAVRQDWYRVTPDNVFSPQIGEAVLRMSSRLSTICFELGDKFVVEQCIRVGSEAKRKALLVPETELAHLARERRRLARRMLDGADVDRYEIVWPGIYLIYDSGQLYNPKTPSLLDRSKVLVKRVAARLTAAWERASEGDYFYPLNTIYTLVRRGNEEPEMTWPFVTALLNASLADWYYKTFFEMIAVRGGYVEFREYLQYVPIRRIRFGTPPEERKRLTAEAKRLHQQGLEGKGFASLLSFVDARLPTKTDGSPDTLKEQSDVVHDLLADLAQQMTDMNAQKHEETKGLLSWLEGYVGISVEDLHSKTKIRKYYVLPGGSDEFMAALDQNRSAIQEAKGIDITRREPREAIRQEYEASMARLRPLLRKIELTDRLIDLIVYRLYGLTDEEIAIVESRA